MPDNKLGAALSAELINAGFLGEVPSPEAIEHALQPPAAPKTPAPKPVYDPPKPPDVAVLLGQNVWWWPDGKPPVRIASMDRPWRLNTVRFLERRAAALQLADHMSMFTAGDLLGPPPDDVAADLLAETPLHWLRRQPLMRALRKNLPTRGAALQRLEARAVHWHTCPMRLAYPGKKDQCVCIRKGFRIVGATNDPSS